jgi:hypothetical protein
MIRFCRPAASGIALALLRAAAPLAMAQTAGGMAYVNGGFDQDEATDIRQAGPNYSLRMQFSRQHNGEFALPSAGPLTDVMLLPGTYQVSASYEGRTETQQISVGGAGRAGKDISFRWKDAETP